MASVYRAEGIDDINLGQIAAIKVPAPGLLDDTASRQRFIQEIQVSQKLSPQRHRAIVETLGYVRLADPHTHRPLYGLVLEFIDGQTLAHWLAQRQASGKPITLKEVQVILEAVCDALEHAHGQSPPILHRDVKPHNVMVTRDKRIKLMDFGIARVLEDRRQTQTGSAVGTWAYLPPEFLDPRYQPDVRSDVSLAANLLVELLTFHPQGNPERRSDCPKAWIELIGRAMNRVMSMRPASIREFRDRLRAGCGEVPSSEPGPAEATGPTADPKPEVEITTQHQTPVKAEGGKPYQPVPRDDELLISVLGIGPSNSKKSSELRKALEEKTGVKYTHATRAYLNLCNKYSERVKRFMEKGANRFYRVS